MLTPAIEQLFNVTDADVGRPLTDFTHKLVYDGVEKGARKVLKNLAPLEEEVQTRDGHWLMIRLRPYRTVGGPDRRRCGELRRHQRAQACRGRAARQRGAL